MHMFKLSYNNLQIFVFLFFFRMNQENALLLRTSSEFI